MKEHPIIRSKILIPNISWILAHGYGLYIFKINYKFEHNHASINFCVLIFSIFIFCASYFIFWSSTKDTKLFWSFLKKVRL